MTGPRRVNQKNPERHKALSYLNKNPKELKYIVGDYLARNNIIQKAIERSKENKMKYEIDTKIKFADKLFNLIVKEENRVKGYCGNCDRVIFELNSFWAEKGLCIYCYKMIKK